MTKQCKNFMERVEAKIVNSKQPIFDRTEPDRVYYSAFGDTGDPQENLLTYEEEIKKQKQVEVHQSYIEELYNYIGAKLVVPYKYSIPFLSQVKRRKRYASGNPIGEEHIKPILEKSV